MAAEEAYISKPCAAKQACTRLDEGETSGLGEVNMAVARLGAEREEKILYFKSRLGLW